MPSLTLHRSLFILGTILPLAFANALADAWDFPKSEEFRAQVHYWRTGPYLLEVEHDFMAEDQPSRTTVHGVIGDVWFVETVSKPGRIDDGGNITWHPWELGRWNIDGIGDELEVTQTRYLPDENGIVSPRQPPRVRVLDLEARRRSFLWCGVTPREPGWVNESLVESSRRGMFLPLASTRGELPQPVSSRVLVDGDVLLEFDLPHPISLNKPEYSAREWLTATVCGQTGRVLDWSVASSHLNKRPRERGQIIKLVYDSPEALLPSEKHAIRSSERVLVQTFRPLADPEDVTPELLFQRLYWHPNDCQGGTIPHDGELEEATCEEAYAFLAKALGANMPQGISRTPGGM